MSRILKGYLSQNAGDTFVIDSDNSDKGKELNKQLIANGATFVRADGDDGDSDGFSGGLNAGFVSEEEYLESGIGIDSDFGDSDDIENAGGIPDSYVRNVDTARQAAQVIEDAKNEAEEIRAEAAAEADGIRAQAEAEGREAGYNAGMNEANAAFEEMKRSLEAEHQSAIQALEDEKNRYLEELEPQFADVVCSLIERLTGVEVMGHKEVILYLINNAMRGIDNCHSFVISLSDEDYEYVNQNKEEIYGYLNPSTKIELFQDSKLTKNQCKIETENGLVDLSLDVQVSELVRSLMLLNS